MKAIGIISLTVLFIASVFAGVAMSVPAGKTVDLSEGGGAIIFDGSVHAKKKIKCKDCHPVPFAQERGKTEMTMGDIAEGKFCGKCHSGKRAFAADSDKEENCTKCHRM